MRPLNKEEASRLEIRSKEYQGAFEDIANKQAVKNKTVGNSNGNLKHSIGKAIIS